MKLIINIPIETFELLNTTGVNWLDAEHILSAVANGIPLDNIKAEFVNSYPRNYIGGPELGGAYRHFSLNEVLDILDNNTSKTEMENKK